VVAADADCALTTNHLPDCILEFFSRKETSHENQVHFP
jgi:hypothetical protein